MRSQSPVSSRFAWSRRGLLTALAGIVAQPAFAVPRRPKAALGRGRPLVERVPPPTGFRRVPVDPGSFGAFLRQLPTTAAGTPVTDFRGRALRNAPVVFSLDVGGRDLQQCADMAIRVHAEWLWSNGREDEATYRLTSGQTFGWVEHRTGHRLRLVNPRRVRSVRRARADDSYESFRAFLDTVFVYAGSLSLDAQLRRRRPAWKTLQPGDLLVHGGSPGHVLVLVDLAVDDDGRRRALFGQGFMPAQSFHLAPDLDGRLWHSLDDDDGSPRPVQVEVWGAPFTPEHARRFANA